MTTLTALQTAIRLANAVKGGAMTSITDVEFDDIAIALAAAQPAPAKPKTTLFVEDLLEILSAREAWCVAYNMGAAERAVAQEGLMNQLRNLLEQPK